VASLGLEQQVVLLGTRHDWVICFARWTCLSCLLWEGLSLVMLSAMAAGLPVVATSVGGVSQSALQRRVWFYRPGGKCAALADKISECLPNLPAAMVKGMKARNMSAITTATKRWCGRVETVYEQALKVT